MIADGAIVILCYLITRYVKWEMKTTAKRFHSSQMNIVKFCSLLLRTLFRYFPLTQNVWLRLFIPVIMIFLIFLDVKQTHFFGYVDNYGKTETKWVNRDEWQSFPCSSMKDCETIKTNSFYDILQIFYNYLLLW